MVEATWLDGEVERLLDFAERATLPGGGFGWLDDGGRPRPGEPLHTWVNARMTHVFALAHLRGRAGAAALVDHGIAALAAAPLHDDRHGGWYAASGGSDRKQAYPHAFVVLAAASAAVAGRPGAHELLAEACDVVERRFWRADEGACAESFAADWTDAEAYRGANANMHLVEAFLAASDATGDPAWRRRALRIARRVVSGRTRVVEHFDERWRPRPTYHAEHPDDPFRPYGTTVGHALEWSRLLLALEAATAEPPPWLAATARTLFDRAVRTGWAVDGAAGFVYTLDWRDRPVVRSRMHWVVCEAIAAADALHRRTGDPSYGGCYERWWDHARRCFVDTDRGSWHHELGPDNRPAATVWQGKPDVYHAVQACLLPRLPLAPGLAAALAVDPPAHTR